MVYGEIKAVAVCAAGDDLSGYRDPMCEVCVCEYTGEDWTGFLFEGGGVSFFPVSGASEWVYVHGN